MDSGGEDGARGGIIGGGVKEGVVVAVAIIIIAPIGIAAAIGIIAIRRTVRTIRTREEPTPRQ